MIQAIAFQIAPNWTATIIIEAARDQAIAAGWGNPIDDYTASNVRHIVFQPLPIGHPYRDRFFVKINIATNSTSPSLDITVSDGWNPATHVGAKIPSAQASIFGASSSVASPINCLILTKPGIIYGFLGQNSASVRFAAVSLLKNLPSWWNTALYLPYGIQSSTSILFPSPAADNAFNASTPTVYNSTLDALAGGGELNPIFNKRQVVGGPIPVANNWGYVGELDDDLGWASGSGTAALDTYAVAADEVWTALTGNATSQLVARTT